MTREEVQIIIDEFKGKAKIATDLYILPPYKIGDTYQYAFKIFNQNQSVASIIYTDFKNTDIFMVQMWIGYGQYQTENFEIAKMLLTFIKY